jgi:hypothetical protein
VGKSSFICLLFKINLIFFRALQFWENFSALFSLLTYKKQCFFPEFGIFESKTKLMHLFRVGGSSTSNSINYKKQTQIPFKNQTKTHQVSATVFGFSSAFSSTIFSLAFSSTAATTSSTTFSAEKFFF